MFTSQRHLHWHYASVAIALAVFVAGARLTLVSLSDDWLGATFGFADTVTVKTMSWFGLLLVSLGAAQLAAMLARSAHFIFTQFMRPALDLEQRYGSGSWAVVTGGSAGIGLGFAVELARRHFNIVLISRSREHLEAAEKHILEARGDSKVRLVAADFRDGVHQSFWDDLYTQHLSDIDVSILINNVGINHTARFEEIPEDFLLSMVPVNCTSQLMMTRKLINHFVQRCKGGRLRSAIVSLSSVAGQRPLLYLAPYSASKAFNDFFSRALALEFGDTIDILSLRPGYVVSNMSKLKEKSVFVLDRYECASGCLEKLGRVQETYGNPRHAVYARSYFLLPDWVLSRRRRKRLEEKGAAIAAEAAQRCGDAPL